MTEFHIINPFRHASGGSENRAMVLASMLQPYAKVTLWATGTPDPHLASQAPIRVINPFKLAFPRTGTFIFVGAYYWLTSWIKLARPSRCIVVFNTPDTRELHGFLERISGDNIARCELVYASTETAAAAGMPGTVEPSPIDLTRFKPRYQPQHQRHSGFVVGRLSRDIAYKFHADEPAFLARLAAQGMTVRVMGGTCLRETLAPSSGVELLPACAESANDFLSGLDCFYYRTSPEWHEPFGRVIFEAMACAIPPVCHVGGDYARFIRSGENGFLFRTEAEAAQQIKALRSDPALRKRIGAAARHTVEAMYDKRYWERVRAFYLTGAPPPVAARHAAAMDYPALERMRQSLQVPSV
jgi:glycosyltransferase involved in cell wall biosynthesis